MKRANIYTIEKNTYQFIFGLGMFFILLSASKFINNNFLTNNSNVLAWSIGIILFVISIFYTKFYTVKEIFFVCVVLIVGSSTTYFSKSSEPIMMALYVVSCRKIEPYNILKILFVVNLILFLTNFVLYRMGILIDFQNFSFNKHSFGYGHPNSMGVSVFTLITISLSLLYKDYKEKKKITTWLLALQIPLIALVITSGSRGAEIASLISFLFFFLILVFGENKNFLYGLVIFLLVAMILFSIITFSDSVNVVGSFLYNLNQLFTQRLVLNNYFYRIYGIPFLGQKVEYNLVPTVINSYAFIDNAYVKSMINFGILYSILYCSYIVCLTKKIITKKELGLIIPLVSFIVYGVVEQGFLQYWVNFSMFFSGIFFDYRKKYQ